LVNLFKKYGNEEKSNRDYVFAESLYGVRTGKALPVKGVSELQEERRRRPEICLAGHGRYRSVKLAFEERTAYIPVVITRKCFRSAIACRE